MSSRGLSSQLPCWQLPRPLSAQLSAVLLRSLPAHAANERTRRLTLDRDRTLPSGVELSPAGRAAGGLRPSEPYRRACTWSASCSGGSAHWPALSRARPKEAALQAACPPRGLTTRGRTSSGTSKAKRRKLCRWPISISWRHEIGQSGRCAGAVALPTIRTCRRRLAVNPPCTVARKHGAVRRGEHRLRPSSRRSTRGVLRTVRRSSRGRLRRSSF